MRADAGYTGRRIDTRLPCICRAIDGYYSAIQWSKNRCAPAPFQPDGIPPAAPVAEVETGFLAKSAEEFAQSLHEALSLSTAKQQDIRMAARSSAEERFSEAVFNDGFGKVYEDLVQKSRRRRRNESYVDH